jgi:uncharacterized phiE125 gp8 family phage protein
MITNATITPASSYEVVSLALAKMQLRIESSFTAEDTLIQSMIASAVSAAEDYMGCKIVDSDVVLNLDELEDVINIPYPVRSVTSLKYFPTSGAEETMPDTDYELLRFGKENGIRITAYWIPETDTRYDAVTIAFKTGYATGTVPKPIIQAVLLQISDMYDRREDRVEVPLTMSTKLLRPYKLF